MVSRMTIKGQKNSLAVSVNTVIEHCISEILHGQTEYRTIFEKSTAMDKMLETTRNENKDLKNLILDSEKIEINQNFSSALTSRISVAQNKIGNWIIEKVSKEIPLKYTKLLENDINDINSNLIEALEDPDQFLTKLTKKEAEKFLQTLKNPFVTFNIDEDSWKVVTTGNNPHIECNLKFKLNEKMKQPVVKLEIDPPIGKNPLLKIKFKISGEGTISGTKLSYSQKKFKIILGKLEATFSVVIEETKIMDALSLPKQDNEPLYKIFEKKYESNLPEISITP